MTWKMFFNLTVIVKHNNCLGPWVMLFGAIILLWASFSFYPLQLHKRISTFKAVVKRSVMKLSHFVSYQQLFGYWLIDLSQYTKTAKKNELRIMMLDKAAGFLNMQM